MTYMEIYNEIGYDLLDPARNVRALEDLQRVAVREDEAGAVHLSHLSIHRANSEEEALNLARCSPCCFADKAGSMTRYYYVSTTQPDLDWMIQP